MICFLVVFEEWFYGHFFFASALQIFNIGALHCSESFGENKTKLICNYAKWKTTKTKAAVQKLANVKKRCLTFLVVSNYYNQSSGVEGSLSFLHAGDTFHVCFGGSLQCKQRRQGKIKNIKPMFVELL